MSLVSVTLGSAWSGWVIVVVATTTALVSRVESKADRLRKFMFLWKYKDVESSLSGHQVCCLVEVGDCRTDFRLNFVPRCFTPTKDRDACEVATRKEEMMKFASMLVANLF